MNNIVPLRAGSMPAVFASRANLPDMNAAMQQGLQAAFAVIGYKGRNWRVKYRGEDELLKDERGVPVPQLPVVIVGVNPNISKQFYDKRYAEGDNEAPDCFSHDGIKPDPASPKLQCATCAACPQNAWGSRVNESGKKIKACADSRRIAVVPLGDIENESYGGPMLLRVPPMSLANLSKYGTDLARYGGTPFSVGTALAFDYDVAYPLITFQALGWLDEDQATRVLKVLDDPLVARILELEPPEAVAETQAESALAGGGPAAAFANSVVADIGPAPKAEPKAEPKPEPKPEPKAEAPVHHAPKKSGGFATAAAAPAAPSAPPAEPKAESVPTVVSGAPAGLEAAINDLLTL